MSIMPAPSNRLDPVSLPDKAGKPARKPRKAA